MFQDDDNQFNQGLLHRGSSEDDTDYKDLPSSSPNVSDEDDVSTSLIKLEFAYSSDTEGKEAQLEYALDLDSDIQDPSSHSPIASDDDEEEDVSMEHTGGSYDYTPRQNG